MTPPVRRAPPHPEESESLRRRASDGRVNARTPPGFAGRRAPRRRKSERGPAIQCRRPSGGDRLREPEPSPAGCDRDVRRADSARPAGEAPDKQSASADPEPDRLRLSIAGEAGSLPAGPATSTSPSVVDIAVGVDVETLSLRPARSGQRESRGCGKG